MDEYTIGPKQYPVLDQYKIPGTNVIIPVVDMQMMSDFQWNKMVEASKSNN